MNKILVLGTLLLALLLTNTAWAMEGMDHKDMDMDDGTFKHTAMVDGIHAEFQVMSLASMNMKDESGATHHVMVSFKDKDGNKIENVIGRVKIVHPNGEEEVVDLKDYSGILASNFTANDSGKYGIICLFKTGDAKHVAKFWWNKK